MSSLPIHLKNQEEKPLTLRSGAIIPIYKPLDWTSFNVVSRFRITVKKTLGLKKIKVGHAGTLDPKATGLLLLCTGRATKKIEELMLDTKEYVTTLKLGATTASFDTEHEEDATYPYKHITREMIEEVLAKFTGNILQEPPLFSAVSVNGTRAYELARKGEGTKLKKKAITIHNIEILNFDAPFLKLRVTCGKGTYIRSLARDIGEALQSGAYLTQLERTKVGTITLQDSFSLDEITALIERAELQEEGFEPISPRVKS